MSVDFAVDLDRVTNVCDPDYETPRYNWRMQTYYHTGRRCYVTRLVGELLPGAPARPADPDAAINAAAPLFEPENRGRHSSVAGRVEDLLRERGPMSKIQIATELGVPYARVKNYIDNHGPRWLKERIGALVLYQLKEAG